MTVSTLRPVSDVAHTGTTVTGAATRWQAVSDSSDSSYVAGGSTGDEFTITLGAFTLPTGGLIKAIAARMRVALSAAGIKNLQAVLAAAAQPHATGSVSVNWLTPTTVAVIATFDATDYVATDLAAATLRVIMGANPTVVGRVHELYLDVTYVAQPTLTVDLPTGTITTTNEPTVSWTPDFDPDGGTDVSWQVKIFSAAQYGVGGFDPSVATPTTESLVQAGAATSWVTTPLANATYRAYVRLLQAPPGQLVESDWEFSGFVINVAIPAVPTLALTAQGTQGRMKIDVTHNSGAATTDAVEVQRSLDGGTTWEPVRLTTDTAGVVDTPDATVFDYEGRNGIDVTYRARALHNYSGQFAASAWVTAMGQWASEGWLLKDPLRPELNLFFADIKSLPGAQRAVRQGVFQPLGSTDVTVVSDTRGPETGTVVFQLVDHAQGALLDALIDTLDVLLLQAPADADEPDRYVILGDRDRQRVQPSAWAHNRNDTYPWTAVQSPVGVVDAWP